MCNDHWHACDFCQFHFNSNCFWECKFIYMIFWHAEAIHQFLDRSPPLRIAPELQIWFAPLGNFGVDDSPQIWKQKKSALIPYQQTRQQRNFFFYFELTIVELTSFWKKKNLSFFLIFKMRVTKIIFEYYFFSKWKNIFLGWGRTVWTLRGRTDVVANDPDTSREKRLGANHLGI